MGSLSEVHGLIVVLPLASDEFHLPRPTSTLSVEGQNQFDRIAPS